MTIECTLSLGRTIVVLTIAYFDNLLIGVYSV